MLQGALLRLYVRGECWHVWHVWMGEGADACVHDALHLPFLLKTFLLDPQAHRNAVQLLMSTRMMVVKTQMLMLMGTMKRRQHHC